MLIRNISIFKHNMLVLVFWLKAAYFPFFYFFGLQLFCIFIEWSLNIIIHMKNIKIDWRIDDYTNFRFPKKHSGIFIWIQGPYPPSFNPTCEGVEILCIL